MRGSIRRWAPMGAQRFRAWPPSYHALTVIALVALGVTVPLNVLEAAPGDAFWTRAQLTATAAIAFAVAAASIRGTTGRIWRVRIGITAAIALWLLAEIVRNVEIALHSTVVPGPSDLFLGGVLACAGMTYVMALNGQVDRREEISLYLDALILFLGTAASLLIVFGPVAASSSRGSVDLAYVIFFASTTSATFLLDLTVRAERRLRGAYVILGGLTMLGAAYVARMLTGEATGILPEAGWPSHLVTAGLLTVAYGTATWNDVRDDDPGYARLSAMLRSWLPLVAVAVTPGMLVAAVVLDLSPAISLVSGAAIALVLVTVALRQSLLLRERESAVMREMGLSRDLAAAEAKYRALVERQPGIVYLAEPGAHGKWHYVSPQIEHILGFTPGEWLDDPTLWARRIHPEDRDEILAAEYSTPHPLPGGSRTWEYRVIAADGREVWMLDDESVAQVDGAGRPTLVQGVLLDITERKRAEEALRVSEEQTRLIIETASYAFIGMDADGRVAAWNQRAAETFGWSRDEAHGRFVADLIIPEESRDAHRRGLAHYRATGEGTILSKRIEVSALHRDGRRFPVELTIWPVQSGDTVRFNALVDDITVRKQLEEQLRHQAVHDALTGLPNRVLFADRLQHALDRAHADASMRLAVFFIDIDDFKTVNDSLGHTAGDQLLAAVADRLEAAIRPEDTAARLGGDEFAILVEDGAGADPSSIASRILGDLSRPFNIDGKPVSVQASVGVSVSGPEGASPDELLRNADLAMYLAKARGKNRHELYTPGMHEQAQRRLELKRMLEAAVEHSSLELHYQPVVLLADGSIVGMEALLRWRGEAGEEFVPLSEVIPIAEETGLIIPIGRWVLERACRDIATWRQELGADQRLDLAVNVSPVQLEHGGLAGDVERALAEAGLPASSLVLELTESALTNDSLDTVRTLRALRARGIRIALDDFGTGYSSLGRLRRFSVDIVKIDRSFISAVGTQRGDPIVQSIIDLGRSLGMEVVAEGIETRQQAEALRSRGAQLGQGYHFAKPLPAAAVASVLMAGRLPRRRGRKTGAARARGA